MVERFGNGVVSPLVIDTPNQQEQSDSNYDRIINLLSSKLNQNQVIMSAMENEHLKPLISSATVITLDSDKLLKPALYESVKAEIDSLK
jgi:hypothetical protein